MQVLVERHRVAETVSQFIAELLVDFRNGIRVRRLTDKKIERNFPVRVGQHRASGRKWKSEMAGVVLISAEESASFRIDLPGQRWCDVTRDGG